MLEWIGGCESLMERFERRKLLYAVLVFYVHVCSVLNFLTMHVAGQ